MKSLRVALLPAAMLAVLFVAHLVSKGALEKQSRAEGPKTLEGKLQVLAKYGLRLAEPFTVDDLLEVRDREVYEKPGYDWVLFGLGTAEDRKPFRQFSRNLWHTDFECIEEDGDYRAVVKRMAEMCGGDLVLKDIRDKLDRVRGEARVSLVFRGKTIRYDLEMNGDYLDFSLFEELADLLEQTDTNKVFIYRDLGGHDGIFGCVSEEQYRGLKEEGIGFRTL